MDPVLAESLSPETGDFPLSSDNWSVGGIPCPPFERNASLISPPPGLQPAYRAAAFPCDRLTFGRCVGWVPVCSCGFLVYIAFRHLSRLVGRFWQYGGDCIPPVRLLYRDGISVRIPPPPSSTGISTRSFPPTHSELV